jgi:hypothetical protein
MYGVQIKESGKRQVRAMMCLRRKVSDASKGKPGWKAFSESVLPLIGGAGSQARHLTQVSSASQHQWPALRTSTCALTSGLFGRRGERGVFPETVAAGAAQPKR